MDKLFECELLEVETILVWSRPKKYEAVRLRTDTPAANRYLERRLDNISQTSSMVGYLTVHYSSDLKPMHKSATVEYPNDSE